VSSIVASGIRRATLAALATVLTLATLSAPGAASTTPDTSRDSTLGFVVDRGRVERIDLPPDARGTRTILSGINNRGQLVGKYPDPDAPGFHGMLLDRRRGLTRFDYPGALATYANKINNRGQTVGSANRDFPRVGFPEAPGTFGYLLERGRFTKIAYPGAVQTQALGINRRGQVVGEYLDRNGVFHGFRWDRGRFRTFDGPDGTGASITDINDRGDMVGAYVVPDDTDLGITIRGFLLHKGNYTTFDALGFPFTVPYDINNRGQIAGTAISDADLTEVHGFQHAKGADGPVTQIDVPGAARTEVYGLDDRGRLVGMYLNPDAAPRGQRSRASQPSLPDTWPLGLAETQETP
jgi:probable HAF family extracellular repeat protein